MYQNKKFKSTWRAKNPFNLIKAEHFLPAIKHYIKIAEINIADIISNKNPNFENTILALEFSTEGLDEIVTVFRHLFGSEANDGIKIVRNKKMLDGH